MTFRGFSFRMLVLFEVIVPDSRLKSLDSILRAFSRTDHFLKCFDIDLFNTTNSFLQYALSFLHFKSGKWKSDQRQFTYIVLGKLLSSCINLKFFLISLYFLF